MKNPTGIIFSISGLSFWFLLGFPFANYHESYEWIAQVQTMPAWDLIFSYVGHYASYRPLGQFLAILLYKNIAHSMLAIQIFNYIFSILGILFILKSHSEKALPLFISFFLIGLIFYPTFNYLFHLNGFFYSPLTLLLGILYFFSLHEYSFYTIVKTYFVAIFAALFHPFAIVIFVAFLAGWTLENKNSVTQKIVILGLILISSLIILFFILVDGPFSYLTYSNLAGTYYVFASLENNILTLLLSFLLSIVTAYSISKVRKSKYILLSVSVFLSVLFVFFKVPLIFLVILTCLVKLIYRKKWTLVSLMFVLILFPLFAGTISNSLKFLILYLLPVAIAMDIKRTGHNIQYLIKKIMIAVPVILFIVLILLKLDVQLPVISRIANPLLTEREKSFQLENAIDWLRHSGNKNYSVELLASSNNKRFPASSTNINTYLEKVKTTTAEKSLKVLICFDCDSSSNDNTLYSAKGLYSKNIRIILP